MSDDLCFTPATQLVRMVRAKEISARELLAAHLDRIERVNPAVNAIVTLDAEEAERRAAHADALTARGEALGPLHGLPVAHKDTHLTGGLRTTWGSPLKADFVPEDDELVVARLRDAGAVRVGKTNTPEYAAGSHTFNPVFGVTRNPYAPDRSAGGSSGGSAAALAAGLVPLADGSDMGGSLRNPAAFCNVVGLRPSPGRVPSHPTLMAWADLSVQGPMGRTVGDVAMSLSAMAGPDPRVPISLQDAGAAFAPPLAEDLRGLTVGWSVDLGGRVPLDAEVRDVLVRQAVVLESLGARVVEDCPDLDGADEVFSVLRAWQFVTTFGDVVRSHPDQVKQAIHWNVERGRGLSAADVGRAVALRTKLFERVVEFFSRCDVLVSATTQVVPFDVEQEYPTVVGGEEQRDYLQWMRSCTIVSATTCPALSVPAGFTPDGLPVGLQVIGPPRGDRRVLDVGHAIEQATQFGARRPLV
ncbi:MAG: amidase [Actinomycetes bacterium]